MHPFQTALPQNEIFATNSNALMYLLNKSRQSFFPNGDLHKGTETKNQIVCDAGAMSGR